MAKQAELVEGLWILSYGCGFNIYDPLLAFIFPSSVLVGQI